MLGRLRHWGKKQGFFRGRGLQLPFYPFLVLPVWSWPQVDMSFNMDNIVKSTYNETQGLLEVRFIASMAPAGAIWFSFFVASFLLSGSF